MGMQRPSPTANPESGLESFCQNCAAVAATLYSAMPPYDRPPVDDITWGLIYYAVFSALAEATETPLETLLAVVPVTPALADLAEYVVPPSVWEARTGVDVYMEGPIAQVAAFLTQVL